MNRPSFDVLAAPRFGGDGRQLGNICTPDAEEVSLIELALFRFNGGGQGNLRVNRSESWITCTAQILLIQQRHRLSGSKFAKNKFRSRGGQ